MTSPAHIPDDLSRDKLRLLHPLQQRGKQLSGFADRLGYAEQLPVNLILGGIRQVGHGRQESGFAKSGCRWYQFSMGNLGWELQHRETLRDHLLKNPSLRKDAANKLLVAAMGFMGNPGIEQARRFMKDLGNSRHLLTTEQLGSVLGINLDRITDTNIQRKAERRALKLVPILQEILGAEGAPSGKNNNLAGGECIRIHKYLLLTMAGLCAFVAVIKFDALWPYQLARWALCAGCGWSAYQSRGWRRGLLGALAVIYNPIQPIAFGDLWPWVNGLSAVLLIIALPPGSWPTKESSLNYGRAVIGGVAIFLTIAWCKTVWESALSGVRQPTRNERIRYNQQKLEEENYRKYIQGGSPPADSPSPPQ